MILPAMSWQQVRLSRKYWPWHWGSLARVAAIFFVGWWDGCCSTGVLKNARTVLCGLQGTGN